ncbi:Rrf2 family transcriptional regulator [Aureimonas fodinaquatilis]|uniref:Rrf2 family transcriptional regulator n=1 Tax=Aureimonas fodinaquatilis TaxID=2565783 RepID=A0A5B0DQ24_9HYPH|nr:Rrf2 family transcriptional regulator [Aureimonas fodinaquatilis]KAA0968864.1 Rrf2 family transcriptional regulator [Aureimonas fodinaquatilis]
MRLTAHTDYGLRVLMSLAVMEGRVVTIEELAERHGISRNHLMKVALTLVNLGFVKSIRGRGGGLTLAQMPGSLQMGHVVRSLESDVELVACLGSGQCNCVFHGACKLTGALGRAVEAFFAELDRLTLADLVADPCRMRERLAVLA